MLNNDKMTKYGSANYTDDNFFIGFKSKYQSANNYTLVQQTSVAGSEGTIMMFKKNASYGTGIWFNGAALYAVATKDGGNNFYVKTIYTNTDITG